MFCTGVYGLGFHDGRAFGFGDCRGLAQRKLPLQFEDCSRGSCADSPPLYSQNCRPSSLDPPGPPGPKPYPHLDGLSAALVLVLESVRPGFMIFFLPDCRGSACVRACVRACVHVYIYIYIYVHSHILCIHARMHVYVCCTRPIIMIVTPTAITSVTITRVTMVIKIIVANGTILL